MAVNKEVKKSNRELMLDRLRNKHPEGQYDDDEAVYSQINGDYDAYDTELSGYKEREKKLSDLFSSDPRSASFLTRWASGQNPVIELVKTYGDDFVDWMQDPEHQEEVAAATKEYAERIAKEDGYEAEWQKNIDESADNLEKLKEEDGLSDEEADEALKFLITIYSEGLLGKFSKESLRMALKAIHHDADVEDASNEGEVRGRNANIKSKLRKMKGDGVANLGGKNGGTGVPPRDLPELGALNNMGNASIWERGGEERKRVRS